jgi:hypothetical protein
MQILTKCINIGYKILMKINHKVIGIFIFLIIVVKIFPQEKGLNMLQTGSVKLIKYFKAEEDKTQSIKYIGLTLRGNKYEICINYDSDNEIREYWIFEIINTNNVGKIIKGQLSRISYEINDCEYIDESASGDIEIDTGQKIVTVTVIFPGKDSAAVGRRTKYKIIWENK